MALDIVGIREIADRLGVSVQAVHYWRGNGTLPEAEGYIASNVPWWHWDTIERWYPNRDDRRKQPKLG